MDDCLCFTYCMHFNACALLWAAICQLLLDKYVMKTISLSNQPPMITQPVIPLGLVLVSLAGAKACRVHLCRVAGNTVWSHMSSVICIVRCLFDIYSSEMVYRGELYTFVRAGRWWTCGSSVKVAIGVVWLWRSLCLVTVKRWRVSRHLRRTTSSWVDLVIGRASSGTSTNSSLSDNSEVMQRQSLPSPSTNSPSVT